MSSKEISQG